MTPSPTSTSSQLPEHGVVLQQVPHRLGIPEIVDGHNLEVPTPLELCAKEVPADPPESVDPHPSRSHALSLNK